MNKQSRSKGIKLKLKKKRKLHERRVCSQLTFKKLELTNWKKFMVYQKGYLLIKKSEQESIFYFLFFIRRNKFLGLQPT